MYSRKRALVLIFVLGMAAIAPAVCASEISRCSFADAKLSADRRASCLVRTMSLGEKLALVLSLAGGGFGGAPIPAGALGSAAFLVPPARLHLPALEFSDAGLGVANPNGVRADGAATALPSGLATAATWDPDLARRGGAMIGAEAWREGFNVLLAGGANLTRDPRGGRDFEYAGEDPLLTGRIVGSTIAGVQSQHVMSTIKHFVMNDLETARNTMSAQIDPAALRESDLLAFEIAIETGHPGAVMCSYNRVNDVYACENRQLLSDALKRDWHYPGFVLSDWGATHTTERAARAGLDQESSGDTTDAHPFFGVALREAVVAGRIPRARLDDMAQRIIRSMVACGLIEHPPVRTSFDVAGDRTVARRDEEEGAVLLRNERGILPLSRLARVAVIGGHADAGVLSGGGSSQVRPIGGNPVAGPGRTQWPGDPVYDPSPPLAAMRYQAPRATIDFASGADIAQAVALARAADVAVVFVTQWSYESADIPSLSLPNGQDALIEALARANPHLVVVLETSGPVRMPWLAQTGAVLEAWYPGSGGGEAIAHLLYGSVAPSGRLPITFPRNEAQLAHPKIAGVSATTAFAIAFQVDEELVYDEGSAVGYRWFEQQREKALFPFGYGLTYTTFAHAGLVVRRPRTTGTPVVVSFEVSNTGRRAGTDVAQVYVSLPDGGARRLAGWRRLRLWPGQHQRVSVTLDSRLLARFSQRRDRWQIARGTYRVYLADNAADSGLSTQVALPASTLDP